MRQKYANVGNRENKINESADFIGKIDHVMSVKVSETGRRKPFDAGIRRWSGLGGETLSHKPSALHPELYMPGEGMGGAMFCRVWPVRFPVFWGRGLLVAFFTVGVVEETLDLVSRGLLEILLFLLDARDVRKTAHF